MILSDSLLISLPGQGHFHCYRKALHYSSWHVGMILVHSCAKVRERDLISLSNNRMCDIIVELKYASDKIYRTVHYHHTLWPAKAVVCTTIVYLKGDARRSSVRY